MTAPNYRLAVTLKELKLKDGSTRPGYTLSQTFPDRLAYTLCWEYFMILKDDPAGAAIIKVKGFFKDIEDEQRSWILAETNITNKPNRRRKE